MTKCKVPYSDQHGVAADRLAGGVSRRSLMLAGGAGLMAPAVAMAEATKTEMTVTEALRARRSTRAFSDRPIDPALLAQLLWAACGVNRPETGLRTVPSWHGAADAGVYLATADGVLEYDPASGSTKSRLARDIRANLSPQPFVKTAPACLIHISDMRLLKAAEQDEQKRLYAQIDAAMVAQNVYVFAAAQGLGTCLVGGLDRAAIEGALSLAPYQFAAFVQPVGWPA